MTLRRIFLIVTGAAVFFWMVTKAADGRIAGRLLLIVISMGGCCFLLFAISYLLAAQFAALRSRTAPRPQSPFAQHRLPPQLLATNDPVPADELSGRLPPEMDAPSIDAPSTDVASTDSAETSGESSAESTS